MSDLTIITMEMCESLVTTTDDVGGYLQTGLNSERHTPHCTCPRFKYTKRDIMIGSQGYRKACKHIIEAQANVCGWHEQWGSAQLEPGVCPDCGGKTVPVKVAV